MLLPDEKIPLIYKNMGETQRYGKYSMKAHYGRDQNIVVDKIHSQAVPIHNVIYRM